MGDVAMSDKIDKFDIKDLIPISYRYNQWIRVTSLLISTGVMAYTVFFLALQMHQETPLLMKIIPFVILYVAIDSILRHLTSLNSVTFTSESLVLGFLAKHSIRIPYEMINRFEIIRKITMYLVLYYIDANGKERTFQTNLSFPNMIKILMGIEDMATHVSIDEKLSAALQLYRYKDAYDRLRQDNKDKEDRSDQ